VETPPSLMLRDISGADRPVPGARYISGRPVFLRESRLGLMFNACSNPDAVLCPSMSHRCCCHDFSSINCEKHRSIIFKTRVE